MTRTQSSIEDGPSVVGNGSKERGGVQSIERAFAILEEIARHRDGIGLADLSKRVDLHNSTTFHLVKTMVALGYIRQSKENKRYRVGRMLYTLAASAWDEVELVNMATPVLEELSGMTGESSHLAIRSGHDIVILAKIAGAGAFQMTDRIGALRPAYCTALGKILLSAMPPEQLDRYFLDRPLQPFTDKTITDEGRLRQELAKVQQSGVAFDDGEFNAEARCVAVGIRDFTGQVVASVGISGPIWRLSIPMLQEKTQQLQAVAQHLCDQFGLRVPGERRVPPRLAVGA